MKKVFLIIFLNLSITSLIEAQDNATIGMTIPIIQKDLPQSNIGSIEVVSNLDDTTFIGILPSGSPNVRTNVVVDEGVKSWLQDYINDAFGSSFTASGKKILWIINALRIGKDSSGTDVTSYTKLTADIYNNILNSVQLQASFDTILVSSLPDADISEQLAIAINALYTKSNNSISVIKQQTQLVQTGSKPLTKSSLIQSIQADDNFKILSDSIYQAGVFKSFQEFLNNAPSVTHFYADVDSGSSKVRLYKILDDSTGQIISDAWGMSIANELYRYQDGQLYAIEKDGNAFTLSKYIDYRSRKNQAFYWRKYVGERQGDNNPFNDAHVYRTVLGIDPSIKVEATQLNMSTGTINID